MSTLAVRLGLFSLVLGLTALGAPQIVQGRIEKNVDGDTVHVQVAGQKEPLKIRMIGIDAPETHFPTTSGHGVVGQQPWGDYAAAYLQKMVKVGDPVSLQTWGLDKYGRTLAFVFSKNVDVNLQMVRAGWAVPYIICSGRECTRDFFKNNRVRDYLMSCDAARKEKRGIYDPRNPLTETPYLFRIRMNNTKPEKYVGNYDTMELSEPKDYAKIDLCRRIFFLDKNEALRIGFRMK